MTDPLHLPGTAISRRSIAVGAFSVDGEYSGVTGYLMEGSRPMWRGLVTSLASAASEVGALLAVGISALTVSVLSTANLDAWGWRMPFLVGAVLAGVVLVTRSTMQESPEFKRQQTRGTVSRNPLRWALLHRRGALLRTFAISALVSILSYVGIIYVPTFLTSAGTLSERDTLWFSTVAALVVLLVTPLVGVLSDRIVRKPVLTALAVSGLALPIALFVLMQTGAAVLTILGAVLMACLAGGASAVGAVSAPEQLSGEGRLRGLALGATAATAVFGGLTPYVAQLLIENTSWALIPGAMITAVALAMLPVFLKMAETSPARTQEIA